MERVELKHIGFKCEVCGFTSQHRHEVVACERKHTKEDKQAACNHKFQYSLEPVIYQKSWGDQEANLTIQEFCPKCDLSRIMVISNDQISEDVIAEIFKREDLRLAKIEKNKLKSLFS